MGEEVERMVAEAEKYKAEDEANAKRIQAKNEVENYCYSMKNAMNDEKLQGKIDEADKKTVLDKVEETISWLEANQEKETEEYEEKKKEVESVCSPIMQKVYAAAAGGAGGMPGGMPGGFPGAGAGPAAPADEDEGPKIEEVD